MRPAATELEGLEWKDGDPAGGTAEDAQQLLGDAQDASAWKAFPSWVQARILGAFDTGRYPRHPCALCVERIGHAGPPETLEHVISGCVGAQTLVGSAMEALRALGEAVPALEEYGAVAAFLADGSPPSAEGMVIRARLMGALEEELRGARRRLGDRDMPYAQRARQAEELV